MHLLMYKMYYSRLSNQFSIEAASNVAKPKPIQKDVQNEETKKCDKLLDLMLSYGMDVNLQCNSKYTPFLLAVRLGNPDMIRKLLDKLINKTNRLSIEDLNLRTGLGMNTAYHIAAAKTNF